MCCPALLLQAINDRHHVAIDVILTQEENESFLDAMNTQGYNAIDLAVGNIKSENATASQKADLDAIRALVQSKPGGFATLNATVKQVCFLFTCLLLCLCVCSCAVLLCKSVQDHVRWHCNGAWLHFH